MRHATLRDAILYFSDFDNCKKFIIYLRWRDGVVKCPVCGASKLTWLAKRRVWKCYAKHTRPTFSLKTGTIFEDSAVPLEKWLPATWTLVNSKNGISSGELHRALGLTRKTAWFMIQRVRLASEDQTRNKLAGEIEVDERKTKKSKNVGRRTAKAKRAREAERPPLTREQFEARRGFRRLRSAMRRLLKIPKAELDARVAQARKTSPRAGNPNAAGRKPKPHV